MAGLRLIAGTLALGLVGAGAQAEASTISVSGAPGAPASELLQHVAVQPYSLTYSVRNIQILLNELGYNAGTPDGVAGAKTRAAISAFQSDKGYPVNGTPSQTVFIQLQQAVAAMQGGAAQPQPTTGAQASASSELIVNTQAELRKRGYNIPSITGTLDSATVAAIRAYQQDAGLPVTGQPSQSLLTLLQSAPGSAAASAQAQREQVMAVQQALNSMGYDAGPVDGALGPKARAAIRTYEADHSMPITGNVSAELLASLGVGAGYGEEEVSGEVAAEGGASAEQAYEIEQYLEALGYDTGSVDGVVDAQTQSAIMSFQSDMDLTVDGQATPQLLTELQTAYNEALAELEGTAEVTTEVEGEYYGEPDPATIQAIETALKQKGYIVGPVDGVMDSMTQKAITDFIRHAQLTIAAEPTPELLAAIEGSAMTAKQGMRNDLIRTGVDALKDILQSQ